MGASAMTWEEKLARLKEIAPTHLEMRRPGDWYVSAHGREMARPGYPFLAGRHGDGATPEEAVEDDWRQVAEDPEWYVVLGATGPDRRHVRWDGWRWVWMPVAEVARPARGGGGV